MLVAGVFLPLEIWELAEKPTGLEIVATGITIAAVAWLIWSKRLFGVRGSAACRAEHTQESLLTLERAGLTPEPADDPAPGP